MAVVGGWTAEVGQAGTVVKFLTPRFLSPPSADLHNYIVDSWMMHACHAIQDAMPAFQGSLGCLVTT